MLDPENPDLHLPGADSSWPDFTKIQINEEVWTNCSLVEAGGEISEGPPPGPGELNPDLAKGPWTLVCLLSQEIQPDDFDLDSVLSGSGITTFMAPNIVEHKDHRSYELVVAQSCVQLLSTRLDGFQVITNYDPFASAESDIRIHGSIDAKRRARADSLANAVEAVRKGWGVGPEECYRNVAVNAGLETALERAILDWDIQEAEPQVLDRFTQNLLFLGLNLSQNHTLLLERDQNDWLQPFRNNHTALSELFDRAQIPIGMQKAWEKQTTSIFRRIFEFSGGRVDNRQHDIDLDFTACENAAFCASWLRVSCSRRFGDFDAEEMHSALFRSQIFAESSSSNIPNHLPSQLLDELSTRQVGQIHNFFEQVYHHCQSLRKPENNVRLLFTWSFMPHGQSLEVLRHWIGSEEGLHLYQQLMDNLRSQRTPEEFALTLAALLGRERLLLQPKEKTVQRVDGGYLVRSDAILNGEDGRNKRTIFERIITSLLRVLDALEDDSTALIGLLTNVLDKGASVLDPLDGATDQYCAKRIDGLDHREAFQEARTELLRSAEAMQDAGTEWVVVPRLPLGPVGM